MEYISIAITPLQLLAYLGISFTPLLNKELGTSVQAIQKPDPAEANHCLPTVSSMLAFLFVKATTPFPDCYAYFLD